MLKGFVSGEEKDIKRITMGTRNLFDGTYLPYGIGAELGVIMDMPDRFAICIPVEPNTSYTISRIKGASTYFYYGFTDAIPKIGMRCSPFGDIGADATTETFTNENHKYLMFFFGAGKSESVMLNLGSTPLPYEPYGYQEGWEVRDSQDRLIWGREDELQTATGTLPFKGYTLPVKVKSILGNAVQNGTPAPDNIIMPEMCGVRTAQLIPFSDKSFVIGNKLTVTCANGNLYFTGDLTGYEIYSDNSAWKTNFKFELPAGAYYIKDSGVGNLGYYIRNYDTNAIYTRAFTLSEKTEVYFGVYIYNKVHDNEQMFAQCNSGSTALPYEPYGWKVPFENHGENLWDEDYTGISGTLKYVPIYVGNGDVTISTTCGRSATGAGAAAVLFLLAGSVSTGASTTDNGVWNGNDRTVSAVDGYVTVAFRAYTTVNPADAETMLNLGSTPKPYSPYLNATIPVYLGEVQTVRRVKKLVLTGNESWNINEPNNVFYTRISNGKTADDEITSVCTHYNAVGSKSLYLELLDNECCLRNTGNYIWFKAIAHTNVDDFKAYLASEYAAGHPVTIWYALETPETTISNEPLCKISTYADELTTIQVHGLSAPLYGIGDYKDTLNLSTGVVTRKVKKLVLDGTESWSSYSGVVYLSNIIDYLKTDAAVAICTHYQPQLSVEGVSETTAGHIAFSKGSNLRLCIRDTDYTSGTAFKTYLAVQYAAGTPVTVWYVLKTSETETVTVPTGMTGEVEGYLTQVSTPSPTNRSVPKWNGEEETGGTYAVTVYTPPEIPTTTGQNTLTVDTDLEPSKLEVSIHAKRIHYGFKIDKSNDDSDSAVIYTHDAVTMTPAHMDFTNDRFDYGSWGNAFFVRDCYPVALNLDGTIAYRLDPDDYTKKTDGTPSDIFYELLTAAPSDWSTQWKQYYTKDANDNYELNSQSSAPTFTQDTYYKLTYNSSFTGNFMMAFPKVWFYRHEDSQYNYIEISNYKLSDDWKCYAHINASGQEVDFIYLPLFKGVIVNSKLRSLPGQIPQGNTTATTEVNAATALGSRWQIWDHSSVECLNDLLTLMSKSIDSQGRFGQGRSTGYDSTDTVTYGKLQTGTLIKKGKFHGYSATTKEVKVFGIEGFWANRWDRLQGMLLVNNVWKIKMTPPYNFTGTDFVTLSNVEVPSEYGYLSKVQTSEYGSIPASIANGSSTKYFKDSFNKSTTDTCVALRGNHCNTGDTAGFRCVHVDSAASVSHSSIGASPVYK